MAPQPTSFPRTRALSSSCPNGAPHGQISGLLRASSSRRRPSRDRLTGSAAANSSARCVAREFVPNIGPVARGRRWWQRAFEPPLWQAPLVVRPMRQHSCHRAAAWSTAGALVDDNGRRAGSSRTRRAGAGAIRRLPRCAAPRHTSSIGTQHARPCRGAHGCAGGWPASGGDDGALRQRPLGPSGPRRHRVLVPLVLTRQCTVRTRLSGAASLAPGQPRDLISTRTSAPTRMASDVLCSRYMSSFGQSFGGTFIRGTQRQIERVPTLTLGGKLWE